MTYIKATWIACDYEEGFPIISADSFDNLKLALDDYCGADNRNSGKCIGFTPYVTNFPCDYGGYYEYECCKDGTNWDETYIHKFRIYCVEFYSQTKYEK